MKFNSYLTSFLLIVGLAITTLNINWVVNASVNLVNSKTTMQITAPNCNYSLAIGANQPVAYWRLGESSGTIAYNEYSPQTPDGAYNNSVMLGLAGLIEGDPNTAAGFNAAQVQYISIPDDDNLNLMDVTERTIELWFRIDNADPLTSLQVLFEEGGYINGLNIFLDGNRIYVGAYDNYTYGYWVASPVDQPLVAGGVYHVALVFSGADSVTGYLNGESFGTIEAGAFAIPYHDGNIGIGAVNDDTRFPSGPVIMTVGYNFTGIIDEVAVYNTRLSADQIRLHAQGCALALEKSASPSTYDTVGTEINYTYTLTNTSAIPLNNPYSVFDNLAGNESCPQPASLPPDGSVVCTGSYTITQADIETGYVTNQAYATADYNGNLITSNTDTVTVTAIQQPALTIEKNASPSTYDSVGDVIDYTFTVRNTGNVTVFEPFAVFDDRALNESCPATTSLAPGAAIECTGSYVINQNDLDNGSVTNQAYATAQFGGNVVTSNTATATVTAIQQPALTITKNASPGTFDSVGDVISYTFTVQNSGNVVLAGPFEVYDDRASDEACPETAALTPGASIECTGSYAITQSDLDQGSVINAAYATGSFGITLVTSNTATLTVPTFQDPALTLEKTTTSTGFDKSGDVLSYTYAITNTGNVTLTGPVSVNDEVVDAQIGNRDISVTCPELSTIGDGDAFFDIGEILTCQATYTIVQADLDIGSVTNKATASANLGLIEVVSNQDSVTIDQFLYTLTVTVAGNGVVNVTPPGPYAFGDLVTFEPVADLGWVFVRWLGPDASDVTHNGDGTWSLTIDNNSSVQAEFNARMVLPVIIVQNVASGSLKNKLDAMGQPGRSR